MSHFFLSCDGSCGKRINKEPWLALSTPMILSCPEKRHRWLAPPPPAEFSEEPGISVLFNAHFVNALAISKSTQTKGEFFKLYFRIGRA